MIKRKLLVLTVFVSVLLFSYTAFAYTRDEALELLTFDKISFEAQNSVTQNLAFLTKFKDYDITWSTSDESVIAADGTVYRPQLGEKTAMVNVTAEIAGTAQSKSFAVSVLPFQSENEILEKVKDELTFASFSTESIESVSGDLSLPETGGYGTVILWNSSDNSVLRIESAESGYKGVVSNAYFGDGLHYALLTATILYGDSFVEKQFYIHTAEQEINYDYSCKIRNALEEFERVFLLNNNIKGLRNDLVIPEIPGVVITLNSSDTDVIDTTGRVTRGIDSDELVHVGVTFANGYEEAHNIYSIIVLAKGEEDIDMLLDEDAKWVAETLRATYSLGMITSNLTLPVRAKNGSSVVWTSSNPEVLSNNGVVVRTQTDTLVELTFRVYFAEEYREGTVNLIIKALAAGTASVGGGNSGGFVGGAGGNMTLLPDIGIGEQQSVFTDVDVKHWAYQAIKYLSDSGIINGTGDGRFEPDSFATREEFVKMLVLVMELEPRQYATPFIDTDTTDWYYPYVSTAYHSDIVYGVDSVRFGVGESITRQDICTLVCRAFYKDAVGGEVTFGDMQSVSDYALDSVRVLYENGILQGDENGNFNPLDLATRSEIAAIFYRLHMSKSDCI